MQNAYVWAHEICGELQISKISWGSQKWADFLNEIVLGFSRSIGAARFREKNSDFASDLLYTFSALHFLRDGLIFRGPIGRCVPPSGRPCEQMPKVPPESATLYSGGHLGICSARTSPNRPAADWGRRRPLFILSFLPLPSLCSPSLSSSSSPPPLLLFSKPSCREE